MEVSTDPPDHVQLARRLNELHQLLYARGGIRPSNAAVEELTKLLLVRIAAHRQPDLAIGNHRLAELVDPTVVRTMNSPRALKDAFAAVNGLPEFGGRVPGGGVQPVWPPDEPLRITRADVLAEALAIVTSIPLGLDTVDTVGTAFDVFLRGKYEHAGGLGTYLTPDSVVRAMARIGFDLIDPLAGHKACAPVMGDPCCGSGRFLVGMLEEARTRGEAGDAGRLGDSVFGADQSSASVAMARVNLLAYGLSHPEVFTVEDSIVDAALDRLRGRLRLILTNPPFGDGKYDSPGGIARTSAHLTGLTTKRRIDPALAFVARCIDLLAPGGVAGIILPDGVADGPHMRELLLGEPRLVDPVRLEGVVSLPTATFAPAGTMAKTSVVFLRRAGEETPGRRVFLARADHVGFVMRKGAVAADPKGDDLPEVPSAVRVAVNGSPGPRASNGRVLSTDLASLASIDASSLDSDSLDAGNLLSDQGGRSFDAILRVVKKRRVEPRADIAFVSVLHVDELGNIDWLQAANYQPTTPGVVARSGDIIISLLNPAKFRAAVIPESFAEVHCSAEFGVFEPTISPYAALALLQHPLVRAQIAPLGRGTSSSRRRIESGDVLRMVAPVFDDDWADKTSRKVADALAAVAEARSLLTTAYGGQG